MAYEEITSRERTSSAPSDHMTIPFPAGSEDQIPGKPLV
jgi:hypothetical protein